MIKLLRVILLAGLGLATPALSETPAVPPPPAASTQALIAKLNAYVELLNRTLRASESLSRYESWVKAKTGPTGKERVVYGLYSL